MEDGFFLELKKKYPKALDPIALAGCPQASLLPSNVLAGQRRDYFSISASKRDCQKVQACLNM